MFHRAIEARIAHMHTREIVSLHPQAAARYREKVAEIHDALSCGDAAALALVREMITEIRLIPRGKGEPAGLEIVGDLAAQMTTERDANAVAVAVGAGFEPATLRFEVSCSIQLSYGTGGGRGPPARLPVSVDWRRWVQSDFAHALLLFGQA